jgi:baseplate hub protein gp41
MAFTAKKIDVTFTLGTVDSSGNLTTFDDGTRTHTATGLRVSAKVVRAGFPFLGNMDLQVWGMSPSSMNKINSLHARPQLNGVNSVTVTAGDANSSMAMAFVGQINNAWADFGSMPDVPLRVEASAAGAAATAVLATSSFTGPVDAATVLAGLADKAGFHFENGLPGPVMLPASYLWGSPLDQIKMVVDAAGIESTVDDGTLAVWPRGGARAIEIVEVGPGSGQIGYPSFTPTGIIVRSLYNPTFHHGGMINVTKPPPGTVDPVLPARGKWIVVRLDTDIEANMPGGRWESTIQATRTGL